MKLLFNEIVILLSATLDRISTSIKARRWISHREYYDMNYDEIKRGN